MGGSWRDRPVLVTGATGLLGGWIVKDLLARGARVIALVRDGVPDSFYWRDGCYAQAVTVRGDLSDLVALERMLVEYHVDAVFHLAAQTQVGVALKSPYETMESNVRGTYTLLEAIRRSGTAKAIVVASSDKVYGAQPQLPYTEDMEFLGVHPYDASKGAAELLTRSFSRSYRLPIAVARCGNLFGGGDLNWARIVPGTIRSLLRNERPAIRSDGTPVRDYLYVEDAAAAYIDLAEHAGDVAGEAFNYSLEHPLDVLQVVRLVSDAVGVWVEPDIRDGAKDELARQYLSSEKARRVLGWRPHISMEDGLARTVAWYRTYFDSPQ